MAGTGSASAVMLDKFFSQQPPAQGSGERRNVALPLRPRTDAAGDIGSPVISPRESTPLQVSPPASSASADLL